MLETWKFSKGILLTCLVTSVFWFLVLDYAWSQHRSSEILTGVIGGLTVILGMLTAEWLRSAREQVDLTRMRFEELMTHLEKVLYNFDEFIGDQFSEAGARHWDDYNHVISSLIRLSRTTRWPQPNATMIRKAARDLFARIRALARDAEENDHMWSPEERLEIIAKSGELVGLIWAHKSEEIDDFESLINKYRKSPSSEGMPVIWVKKSIS